MATASERIPVPALDTKSGRFWWREIWIWPNLLSLDAPLVALIWQAIFAKSLHVDLSLFAQFALGLAVWIVYVVDRWLDSLRPLAVPTARHCFYRDHGKAAFVVACIAACVEVFVSLFLKPELFCAGTAIALAVTAYLLSVHRYKGSHLRWLPKELIVAAVFAVGTILAPCVNSSHYLTILIPGSVFALLCLLNCAAIEHGELEHFARFTMNGDRTWVTWLASNLGLVATFAALGTTAYSIATGCTVLYGSLALSSFGLIWFGKERSRMSANVLRVMADVPLLLPALVLIRLPGAR